MNLKDYIDQGYAILTFYGLSRKIKNKYPEALIYDDNLRESKKFLIDEAARESSYFKKMINGATDVSFRKFTHHFCGDISPKILNNEQHKKRKLHKLSIEAEEVNLICDVILSLIETFAKKFDDEKDVCCQEKVSTMMVNSKKIIFSFWSYDEDLIEIEKVITGIYDVQVIK